MWQLGDGMQAFGGTWGLTVWKCTSEAVNVGRGGEGTGGGGGGNSAQGRRKSALDGRGNPTDIQLGDMKEDVGSHGEDTRAQGG